MASKSLRDFISSFIEKGQTEKGYGNYYTISGSASDVLLYFDSDAASNNTQLTPEAVQIVAIRAKTPEGGVVIFHDSEAIQSRFRQDREAVHDASAKYGYTKFRLPKNLFNAEEDMSSLQIESYNGNELLIKLPNIKYMIVNLPKAPMKKADFIKFIPQESSGNTTSKNYHTIIYPVSSTVNVASKNDLTPSFIKEEDIFLLGTWLVNEGKSDIEEFNPSPETLKIFKEKPALSDFAPYYDSLLSTMANAGAKAPGMDYEYSIPYSGAGNPTMPLLEEACELFNCALKEWETKVSKIVKRYLGFQKSLFIGKKYSLFSAVNTIAQYYDDGQNKYIKGVIAEGVSYNRSILDNKHSQILTSWHKIVPVINNAHIL